MARPTKQTVEYFPHDADASEGQTLSILFNNFGHEGISAWWLLLERISKTNNHVIGIRNPEDIEFLAAKMHFKPDRLSKILRKMADMEAIDRELFDSGYIWCQHFVDRLESVYRSRHQSIPKKPTLTIDEKFSPQKPPLLATETELPAKETELSVPETPQTKLKETKLKETKVKPKKSSVPVFELPQWINPEIWSAFLEMRKRLKAPLTAFAQELLIKKLDSLRNGSEANAIIEQSIEYGWKGFFPLKDGGNNGNNRTRLGSQPAPSDYESPEEYDKRMLSR
jgi:hypothetical protein